MHISQLIERLFQRISVHCAIKRFRNEWDFRPPLCTYRLNWARERQKDGEMNEMTLPFRRIIQNSSPGSLMLSTLPGSHGGSSTILNHYEWAGKKYFASLNLEFQSGTRTRNLRLSKQAASTTAPEPTPKTFHKAHFVWYNCTAVRRVIHVVLWIRNTPNKQETFSHCWVNVGPPSTTLAQHWTNHGSMSSVCWHVGRRRIRRIPREFTWIHLVSRSY